MSDIPQNVTEIKQHMRVMFADALPTELLDFIESGVELAYKMGVEETLKQSVADLKELGSALA